MSDTLRIKMEHQLLPKEQFQYIKRLIIIIIYKYK